MRTPLLLGLTFTLTLASCGSGSDPRALSESGYEALGSSDYEGALADFESALVAIGDDTSHAEYVGAKLGAVEARIHLDAAAAKDEFLELAKGMPSQITDKDFSLIGGKFANAKEYSAAIAVLDAGMKTFSESPALVALKDNIAAAAERDGDEAALSEMAGLGYL